ncbi:MAG: hypothetical protein WC680_10185 [Sulfuricurvum sp.]
MNKHLFIACMLMMVPWLSNADVIPFFPKPNFTIYFDTTITPDSNLELFSCKSISCEDQRLFEQRGPQYYNCSSVTKSCYVQSYGFAPFMKFRLTYKNKIYESDPFVPGSTLELGLTNEKLIVSEKSWLWKLFK